MPGRCDTAGGETSMSAEEARLLAFRLIRAADAAQDQQNWVTLIDRPS